MQAKKRRTPREVLGTSEPRTTEVWLQRNPEAAEFVREWARMSAAGETDWSLRRLVRYLRAEYGFPFTQRESISRWLAGQEQ